MKSILDPSFKYTPSYSTDIRQTFERLLTQAHQEKLARTPPSRKPKSPRKRSNST